MTSIIDKLSDISDRYEAVFLDLWGCLHNGVKPFPGAVAALEAFRAKGGKVMLLTNAPRPAPVVQKQLDGLGVDRALYDGIVASGDAARAALASGSFGSKVHHIGPPKDDSFFEGLEKEDFYQGIDVTRVPLDEAESVVCTGLLDDRTETPDDYRAVLLEAKNRGLKMLCANPDIIVHFGDQTLYCAGALAAAYTEMGGESLYFGKPHPPIYQLARTRLTAAAGREVPDGKILCVGDGIKTDIQGAIGEDIDSLFIAGGIAEPQTMTDGRVEPARLSEFLAGVQLTPTYTIAHLR
jgi:HAD superfamily hydrolase (TIGR01459 family)